MEVVKQEGNKLLLLLLLFGSHLEMRQLQCVDTMWNDNI